MGSLTVAAAVSLWLLNFESRQALERVVVAAGVSRRLQLLLLSVEELTLRRQLWGEFEEDLCQP